MWQYHGVIDLFLSIRWQHILQPPQPSQSSNDASAAGKTHDQGLRHWWDIIVQIGLDYGYYPNAPKNWLTVRKEIFSPAPNNIWGLRKAGNNLEQQLGLIPLKKLMSGNKPNSMMHMLHLPTVWLPSGTTCLKPFLTLQISFNPWKSLFINVPSNPQRSELLQRQFPGPDYTTVPTWGI